MARKTRRPRAKPLDEALKHLEESLQKILNIQDLELLILKSHIVLEFFLRVLLGTRLNIPYGSVPKLEFTPLALLALGGKEHRPLKKDVLSINELRNYFAHELDDEENFPQQTWNFVRQWRDDHSRRDIALLAAQFIVMQTLLEIMILIVRETLADSGPDSDEATRVREALPAALRGIVDNPEESSRELVKNLLRSESA